MNSISKVGYPTRTLDQVATVVNGGTPKSKVAEYWGGSVQWLTPKDMGRMAGREIGETPRAITEFGLANSSARLIPPNSVILSTRAPIGHLAVNTVPMAFNQGCRGLVPNEGLDHLFLYHFLCANRKLLQELGTGTTFKELSSNNLKSVPIDLPPLEEQRRIVAVLDEAFEGLDRARAHTKTNLRDCQELFDGAISASFANLPEHSTHSTLGQIATFRNGLNFTRTSQGDEVRVVGVGDFKDNFAVPISELSCATIDGSLDESDRLKAGDILTVRSNGNRKLIGRTMLVSELDEPTSFSGFTIRIRLESDRIYPEYLCSYMRTTEARAMLTAGGGGTNISNINQRLLSSFPIVFPDIDVQVEILDRLEKIQSTKKEIIRRYEDTISNVHDLRQSLLQRAFAGELT